MEYRKKHYQISWLTLLFSLLVLFSLIGQGCNHAEEKMTDLNNNFGHNSHVETAFTNHDKRSPFLYSENQDTENFKRQQLQINKENNTNFVTYFTLEDLDQSVSNDISVHFVVKPNNFTTTKFVQYISTTTDNRELFHYIRLQKKNGSFWKDIGVNTNEVRILNNGTKYAYYRYLGIENPIITKKFIGDPLFSGFNFYFSSALKGNLKIGNGDYRFIFGGDSELSINSLESYLVIDKNSNPSSNYQSIWIKPIVVSDATNYYHTYIIEALKKVSNFYYKNNIKMYLENSDFIESVKLKPEDPIRDITIPFYFTLLNDPAFNNNTSTIDCNNNTSGGSAWRGIFGFRNIYKGISSLVFCPIGAHITNTNTVLSQADLSLYTLTINRIARVFLHEMGHILGLDHTSDPQHYYTIHSNNLHDFLSDTPEVIEEPTDNIYTPVDHNHPNFTNIMVWFGGNTSPNHWYFSPLQWQVLKRDPRIQNE